MNATSYELNNDNHRVYSGNRPGAKDCLLRRSFYCESGREYWRHLSALRTLGLGGLLWLLLLGSGPAWGTHQQPTTKTTPVAEQPLSVLVFGDSISAAYGIDRADGWANLLQQRLTRAYPTARAINGSVSGETTQGGRARLQAALDRHNPHLVFIELGGNDALRGYPVQRMRDNLAAMVNMAQSSGAKVVLLGMQIPPNYGPRYTREFAGAFKTVADATRAHLVPFFLEGVALVEGMLQADGIHPTTAAQPTLLNTGWDALVDSLAGDYPLLKNINAD